jgi:hypothetical protein
MHVGDGGFDLVEELAELAGAMAGVAFADDGAGGDVEQRFQLGALALAQQHLRRHSSSCHRQTPFAALAGAWHNIANL